MEKWIYRVRKVENGHIVNVGDFDIDDANATVYVFDEDCEESKQSFDRFFSSAIDELTKDGEQYKVTIQVERL